MINVSFAQLGRRPTAVVVDMHRQRGVTLLVGLVMLVLLTLMAVSAINSTTSSIQVVGNAQFREEATAAAQEAIERVISYNFTANPAGVTSSTTVRFGVASYQVQVPTPTCTSSVAISNSELNMADPADAVCLGSGAATNTGIIGATGTPVATAQSWCYRQRWNVRAAVADTNTGAGVAVNQGVAIRVPAGTDCL